MKPNCFLLISNHKKKSKSNIILILSDDQGWKDAGFMGSRYYETPSLDALASSGMTFTNAYATCINQALKGAGYSFRELQDYLTSIPEGEIVLNTNLTQNPGW